ncbi:unnamed protein product [Callosobruchus maculatus]|uniref:Peptidase M14 domain-containing protein n=1 Tax=Callosobruchus maculatus TaxID=64391 RepID=A0A653BV17_CALMS|nr:unnamed protein product [Callosobruchus maculatus]
MRLLWLLNVTLVAFASALPKRIGPAVATYILNEIIHSSDSKIVELRNKFNWYIAPVVNPDGFVYSFKDRFWRKTRTPVTKPSGKICIGIDPNRNWDFHFGEGGEICNDTYPGPYAFSETCTRELSNFLLNIPEKVQSYIGLHSYSEKILMPYSNSSEHLDNYDQVYKIAKEAAKVLKGVNGEDFGVGTAAEMLPQGSVVGASMDWVKEKMRVPYVVTYELRGKDFILPANQIIPASIETLQSILYSVKEAEHL